MTDFLRLAKPHYLKVLSRVEELLLLLTPFEQVNLNGLNC